VRFEPALWYSAPGGQLSLPGGGGEGDAVWMEDLNLDTPRATPSGELHIRSGDWRVSLLAFAFGSGDRDATAPEDGRIGPVSFAEGDALTASLDFASYEATVGYRVDWLPKKWDFSADEEFGASFEAIGGLRVYDLNASVRGAGGEGSVDELFAEPVAGVRLSMLVIEEVTIDAQTTIGFFSDGGGRSSISWDVLVGFMWNPTENLGVQVGYRQLAFNLQDGDDRTEDFRYRGALAGLYVGAVLRF
jgi:hypothetical protein